MPWRFHRTTALAIAVTFTLFGEGAHESAIAANSNYCDYSDRSILIYVDRTTQYDEVDKELFAQGIGRIVDTFSAGDRVIVHTIAGHYSNSERAFDQCVPGCPDTGVMDWLFGSCKPMEARADFGNFRRTLANRIGGMLDDLQSFDHSDIIRTVARVTQAIVGAQNGYGNKRRLTQVFIFSDLLENSEYLPWPRVIQDPNAKLLDELTNQGLLAQLEGAKVKAFGIGRNHDAARSPLSTPAETRLRKFWMAFFTRSGAKEVYIGRRLDYPK